MYVKMTVHSSILKARQEMKKSIQSKSFSPNFAHSIIALIVSVWDALKMGFFKLYNAIYKKLNHFLPLPFAPRENMMKKRKLTVKRAVA
jgi:hypothetical protein